MPDWKGMLARLQSRPGPQAPSPEAVRRGYEPTDVNLRVVVRVAVGVIVVALVTHLTLLLLLRSMARHEGLRLPASPAPALHLPNPVLQVDPRADLRRLQARERQRLTGYRWLDRSKGVVQIPIERAIERLAAEHGHAP